MANRLLGFKVAAATALLEERNIIDENKMGGFVETRHDLQARKSRAFQTKKRA